MGDAASAFSAFRIRESVVPQAEGVAFPHIAKRMEAVGREQLHSTVREDEECSVQS